MKTVLIIHGIGGHAGIHWQQWLHNELEKSGYMVLMPDLPDSDHPDRQTWLAAIKNILRGIDMRKLTIVGHSLGVTTALDFIEQSDDPVNSLVSVSGFADDYGAALNSYFLNEKAIDFSKIKQKLKHSTVIFSSDDPFVSQTALKNLADELDVKPLIIPYGGHLNTEAGYTEFPELLEVLK